MSALFSEPKDPSAIKDYDMDWSDWLEGDTIATSTWTVPVGITKQSESNTPTVSKIWLSGGTHGTIYTLKNVITTAGARTDERTCRLMVRNQ
jgi:hypothetical protein